LPEGPPKKRKGGRKPRTFDRPSILLLNQKKKKKRKEGSCGRTRPMHLPANRRSSASGGEKERKEGKPGFSFLATLLVEQASQKKKKKEKAIVADLIRERPKKGEKGKKGGEGKMGPEGGPPPAEQAAAVHQKKRKRKREGEKGRDGRPSSQIRCHPRAKGKKKGGKGEGKTPPSAANSRAFLCAPPRQKRKKTGCRPSAPCPRKKKKKRGGSSRHHWLLHGDPLKKKGGESLQAPSPGVLGEGEGETGRVQRRAASPLPPIRGGGEKKGRVRRSPVL